MSIGIVVKSDNPGDPTTMLCLFNIQQMWRVILLFGLLFCTMVHTPVSATQTSGWLKYKSYIDSQQVDAQQNDAQQNDSAYRSKGPLATVSGFSALLSHPHVQDHVLVRFKASAASASEITALGVLHARYLQPVDNLRRMRVPAGVGISQVLETLNASPLVAYAEPDYLGEITRAPNDPIIQPSVWWLEQIRAFEGWDYATDATAAGPIAVFDSGISKTHEDLSNNAWRNPDEIPGNNVDDDGNGYVDDVHGIDLESGELSGHGTAVSGTICGEGNNGLGGVGSAWRCELMDIKAVDLTDVSVSAVVTGFDYALNEKSRLSNHSWGIRAYSQALADVVDKAERSGHLLVVAAANNADNIDLQNPMFPAALPNNNIITVAASSRDETRKSYSNYGPVSVDLAAPTEFASTAITGGYVAFSGTSQATPLVTGTAALIWSQKPGWNYSQVRQHLLNNVRPSAAWNGLVATGGILDMGAALRNLSSVPALSIRNIKVNEIDATATLTVKLQPASGSDVSVVVATRNGTAKAGADYIGASKALNFESGETEKTFTVSIVDDRRIEGSEEFQVTLRNANGARIGRKEASVSIEDNDQHPGHVIFYKEDFEGSSAWVADPDNTDTASAGRWQIGRPIETFSNFTGKPVQAGSTVSGSRGLFTGPSGPDIFCCDVDNGMTSIRSPVIQLPPRGPISISFYSYLSTTLNADTSDYIRVTVKGADRSRVITNQSGIRNIELPPVWRKTRTDISEFAGQAVTVLFEAADYSRPSVIEAGVDDLTIEGEAISPLLPTLNTADITVNEGEGYAPVEVRLVPASSLPVTVSWSMRDGNALDQSDYGRFTGEFSFAPGQTLKTINVPIVDDSVEEGVEDFTVNLINPAGALISNGTANVKILDDDDGGSLPSVLVANAIAGESDGQTTVEARLSKVAPSRVTMNIHTVSGTAKTGDDFWGFTRTLTIPAGAISASTAVTIVDDVRPESSETFGIRVFNVVGAIVGNGQGTITIIDNDQRPSPRTLSIADVVARESGGNAPITVTLSTPHSREVTVLMHTSNGTAVGGVDYWGFTRELRIPIGQTSVTTPVEVLDDTEFEGNETFQVRLFQANGAAIETDRATVTITDDDTTTPSLSIADTVASESAGRAVTRVTLSAPTSTEVRVGVYTVAGTAKGRAIDFRGFTRTLTLPAGTVEIPVTIQLTDDGRGEPDESFKLRLVDPVGAVIGRGQGTITVRDD